MNPARDSLVRRYFGFRSDLQPTPWVAALISGVLFALDITAVVVRHSTSSSTVQYVCWIGGLVAVLLLVRVLAHLYGSRKANNEHSGAAK